MAASTDAHHKRRNPPAAASEDDLAGGSSTSSPAQTSRKKRPREESTTQTTDPNHLRKRARVDSADSVPKSGHERKPQRKSRSQLQGQQERVAGVQKIKSALRQCKRLLAKDKLAADKRVQAERQLAALTDELSRAVISRKERDMSAKYHMVKFFERQKILRKIAQAKRAGDDQELWERRIDLAYVLNFPKTEKYISLLKSVDTETEDPASRTAAERVRIRSSVEALMRSGELSVTPEEEFEVDASGEDSGRGHKVTLSSTITRKIVTTKDLKDRKGKANDVSPLYGKTGAGGSVSIVSASTSRSGRRNQNEGVQGKPKPDLRNDDFFDAESSSDEQVAGDVDDDGSGDSEDEGTLAKTETKALNSKRVIDAVDIDSDSD